MSNPTFNGIPIITAPNDGYSDLHLIANDAVSASVGSVSQSVTTYKWNTQWWTAEVTFPPMTRAQAQPWQAFLLALNGMANYVLIGNKAEQYPLGSIPLNTNLVCNGNATQGASALSVRNFPPNTTGSLVPGDNIQIGYRLYKVTAETVSDVNGYAAVSVFPYIRDTPQSADPVTFINCKGLFQLTKNPRGWSYSPHAQWGIDPLSLREAL